MKILVTGGLGYIGSHVAVCLMEKDYDVVIIDNLENSSLSVLKGIQAITDINPIFEQIDLRFPNQIDALFSKHPDLDGIIHFASYKAVGESVERPLKYYENNVHSLIYLLKAIKEKNIPFIFSSSCTVYGQAEAMPIKESAPFKEATSPYGKTKQIGETIIRDLSDSNRNFNAVLLRYFNPVGAHPSALIGELPQGTPQNLVPFITQTVAGKHRQLSILGNDYPTPDGTCIRDYIHVIDLAEAHIKSIEFILGGKNSKNCEIFNIGTGAGHSVLEVVNAFERATGKKVPYRIAPRRQGDVISAYADTTKANSILGWQAQFTLEEALESAWRWETESKTV